MTKTNPSKKSGADKRVMRDRRALPSRQRTYTRLRARVDHFEDAISHFYNVINELRRRVSTLEKKSKPLAKDVVQRRDRWCGGVRRPPETASAKCHPKNSYVILIIGAFVQMKPARLPSWYLQLRQPRLREYSANGRDW
jgi:hypothetical protein